MVSRPLLKHKLHAPVLCNALMIVLILVVGVVFVTSYLVPDVTRKSGPLIHKPKPVLKYVPDPKSAMVDLRKCPKKKRTGYLTEKDKKKLTSPEVVACTLQLLPSLQFYGSFEDIRHAAVINPQYMAAAADLFNKNYDFSFPLAGDYLFMEEYVQDVRAEFIAELTSISRNNRAAYASRSQQPRPLVLFLSFQAVSNFYARIEDEQNAALRADLVNSTLIIVSQGVDAVPSTFFDTRDDLEGFLRAPYLRMWFVQNCDIHHPKVRPLPVGTSHQYEEAKPTFNRTTLAVSEGTPYLATLESRAEWMITWLQTDDKVLQGLDPEDVDNRWQSLEECDTETLRGAERRTLNHSGASHSPCLLKELGDQCEVVLLAANVRSMSSQDRCGVLGRDRAHFEQITGLADKPRLAVFVQQPQAAGGLPTVYLPLVDLYYIFMASTLGHPRRKMRIYGAFSTSTNQTLRSRARADMLASGLGDFQVSSRAEDRRRLSEYAFTASPIGNGYDCHRTWEALLAGSIPIVNSPRLFNRQTVYNSTAMADIFADLPIFVVDSYRDLTEATLKAWASEVRAKAARGEYKFEKLFSYHYLNEIRKLF